MEEDLTDYRKSYQKGALSAKNLKNHPMHQFRKWFLEVEREGGVEEANAMTVATIGEDHFPQNRVVLLKKYDDDGFYFYTNYKSAKGKAIEKNNQVCLSFFWPNLERQVVVKGLAEKTSHEDSEEYFHSRPKGSQIGAMASPQSEVIASREVLESNLEQLDLKYADSDIPRPSYWGGYLVKPVSIEFWQGRANRLHDRLRYRLEQEQWVVERLAP